MFIFVLVEQRYNTSMPNKKIDEFTMRRFVNITCTLLKKREVDEHGQINTLQLRLGPRVRRKTRKYSFNNCFVFKFL